MNSKIQTAIAFGAAAILYTGTLLNASDKRTASKLAAAKESGADTTALLAGRADMDILEQMMDGNDYIHHTLAYYAEGVAVATGIVGREFLSPYSRYAHPEAE
jgi:hypothetical protein